PPIDWAPLPLKRNVFAAPVRTGFAAVVLLFVKLPATPIVVPAIAFQFGSFAPESVRFGNWTVPERVLNWFPSPAEAVVNSTVPVGAAEMPEFQVVYAPALASVRSRPIWSV